TVFFLSDGAPSAGEIRDPGLLLDLVTERNRELELRFHCVVLTNDLVGREFMTGLAARSGGQVVSPLD
ncbi:MAG: hypothetical protein H6825_03595, partial [Planctomycetes bacterium]|nr:hypothetical protein [Planctomycetota bacterium]